MSMSKMVKSLPAGVLLLAIFGCANVPESGRDVAVADGTPAKVQCKVSDRPLTGSAIARKNCGADAGVAVVDAADLMNSKHVAVPDPLGAKGR